MLSTSRTLAGWSLENFGMLPGDYAESLGWTGDDVWHAHCTCLTDHGIGMSPEQVILVNLSGRGDKDINTVARLAGIEL